MALIGYSELMARFAAVKGGVADSTLMRGLGNSAVKEQKLLFAPHTKTGTTVRSIMLGAVTPTSAETRVGFAGPFIELGTREHDIYPKPGRIGRNGRPAALAWGGARRLSGALRAGAQATNFARHVHKRAYPPHPFMVPGATTALTKSGAVLNVIVTRWNAAA